MSVSCNCVDFDGSGHIGNVRESTLEEVFAGPQARRFREELALGRYPIAQCRRCNELAPVPIRKARQLMSEYRVPYRGIMIENTVACNLTCLHCDRGVVDTRTRKRMTLDDLRKVAEMCRDLHMEEIAIHNLGEPFLSRTFLDEVRILREHNPSARLVVSTNGSFVNTDDKREAALMLDYLYFSIDGSNQYEAEQYQRGIDFEVAQANLKSLVAYRDLHGKTKPVIEWKYVVFRWNDQPESIERAIHLARGAGADRISFWPAFGDPENLSRIFPNSPYFRTLGMETWKGREVELRSS